MMIKNTKRRLLFQYLFLALSMLFTSAAFSQINIIRFNNASTYFPGASVSVQINPTTVFGLTNTFYLELSDASGNFATPAVLLAQKQEFFIPVINGIIPIGTAAGTGYKLRIRTTSPVNTVVSDVFTIQSASPFTAPSIAPLLSPGEIDCISSTNNYWGFLNRSSGEFTPEVYCAIASYQSTHTYIVKLFERVTNTSTILAVDNSGQFVIPQGNPTGFYIIEVEEKYNVVSSVSSFCYLFNTGNTGLGNLSNENVCMGSAVNFNVDALALQNNYRGSKYTVNYGDGTPILTYTHDSLIRNLLLTHIYTAPTCSSQYSVPQPPGTALYYKLDFLLQNKGIAGTSSCDVFSNNGNGTTKWVNASLSPVANFTVPPYKCINSSITAINTTTAGAYGTSSTCLSAFTSTWFYKKPSSSNFLFAPLAWVSTSGNLTIPIDSVNEIGCWIIRLKVLNNGGCNTLSLVDKTVGVEPFPIPNFGINLNGVRVDTICFGQTVILTDSSNMVGLICKNPTYLWTISPNSGFVFTGGTSSSSQNPQVQFNIPGTYTITQKITNSCGTATFSRILVVLGDPTVSFNPTSISICQYSPADTIINFSNAPYRPLYSSAPYLPTSYSWTVGGAGVTTADYEFVAPTSSSSPYPLIKLKAFKSFTFTIQVNGNCVGSNSATFNINLNPRPLITNNNLSQIICSGNATAATNLTSDISGTNFTWAVTVNPVGSVAGYTTPGSGSTIPSTILISNINTPATVTYAISSIAATCSGQSKNLTVTVNPTPLIPAQTAAICSGGTFTVTPLDAAPTTIVPTGTTYTWTTPVSNPVGSITGGSAQTTGQSIISQTLTNTTNAAATLTYTVTPTSGAAGSCVGTAFTVTVTVNPDAKSQFTTDTTISCAPFNIRQHINVVRYVNANDEPQYKWYADGVLIGSGLIVPNYSISLPGDTVIISLVAKSKYGCKDDTSSITLYTIQTPVPSFTKSKDTACGPASIVFTNTTRPINVINNTSYLWNFGNGTTSTLVQPNTVTFLPNPNYRDTMYQITLTVTTACQTVIKRDSVLIRPGSKALFMPDTTVGCSPFNLCFRNNSLGMPNTYIWDWGDGTRDTTNNNNRLCHRFTTGIVDTFTVKLYSRNECKLDSFAVDIIVFPATIIPKLIVNGPNSYGCAPRPVTFVNNSVGGTLYTITFGDGSAPFVTTRSNDTIRHTYLLPGIYIASMRATNECTDTSVSQQIVIYQSPVANFITDRAIYCQKDTVRTTNLSTVGMQYNWNFGDGTLPVINVTNPVHNYASPGTFTITLTTTNSFAAGISCSDTARKQVIVRPSPTALFTSNEGSYNCAPFTFTGNTVAANYSNVDWYFINSVGTTIFSTTGFNSNYIFTLPGNYTVMIIAYNNFGCVDTLRKPIVVMPSPIVAFYPGDTSYCGPSKTITFTNQTTYTGTDIVSYQWSVNGVVLSTSPTTFTYTFFMPPTQTVPSYFTVQLMALTSVGNCVKLLSHVVSLLPTPQPLFTITPRSGCAPIVVSFNNQSTYADTYQWYVNNTLFSTSINPPPMTLSQAGFVYAFKLVANNLMGGCGPATYYDTIRTLPTPKAIFNINGNPSDTSFACKNLNAAINNTSYMNIPGNTVGLVYQWYINGILQSISTFNPIFLLQNTSYTRDTLFKIKLVVSSTAGCIDSLNKYVYLFPQPLASFAFNGSTAECSMPRFGLVKTVINNSLSKLPAVYNWTVYNQTSASPINGVVISNPLAFSPTFSFPDNLSNSDTTYQIKLTVTNPNGCTKDTVIQMVVFARPLVQFRISDSTSCLGNLAVTFYDLSTSPTSFITSRLWNFDDGITSNLPTVTHQYNTYGLYWPSLFVINGRGCKSDTMRKRIIIFGPPTANFTAQQNICLGTTLSIVNTSQLGFGSTQFSQILWNFGDGTTSNVLNPSHTYANAGAYTITLTVRSDSSCITSTKSQIVKILGKPKAVFSYTNYCVGLPVLFEDLSTAGYGETGHRIIEWSFGDGQNSYLTNPQHIYNATGTYLVRLIIAGNYCPSLQDTMFKQVIIRAPRPDSAYDKISTARGIQITLSALPGGIYYNWAPLTGLLNPDMRITRAIYRPLDPNRILYTITIKDSAGCLNHDTQEVWIFEKPDVFVPTAFTPNGDGANDVLIPFYINIKSLTSFRIYNRWGNLIFETNNLLKSWDGTIQGLRAPLESYSWIVECIDASGNKIMRKGMVTLLRN